MQVVVSQATIDAAGLAPGDKVKARMVEVRGVSQPVPVQTALRATDLPA